MSSEFPRPQAAPAIRLWTVAALAGLSWALIALAFASLAPPAFVPRLFQDSHVEHFAAFYVVAVLGAAALPTVKVDRIALFLASLAAAFALFRVLSLVNRLFSAEDFLCDLAGVIAGLAPVFVGRFRYLSKQSDER